ncbi:recombinase family protein [Sphingomonas sp. ASV193]|uniref:recombinase family protein n=1 Tax=Sphingomonas sp. ASV193 TaxID=3144405 RepID=UPI0032E86E61
MSLRCAIYTRKSSEEGLEQDFNSLDAQHEACSAYIKSQASEGWKLVRDRYDDGGISGGTLDRPGLKRLLADIEARRIDIVVVYKVDRLTRSLLDFAKLIEAFDNAGTSFVSITQSFSTTTSMGRLTLNMLLSFAQFEREVTAERIRDKIAASKAKGMWMGGVPPIGYRPDGRSLAIVEEDAAIVRQIFGRYSKVGNVRLLANELRRDGIQSPQRIAETGRTFGGRPFSRGQLYRILRNPAYIARIDHDGRRHDANHPAIIDLGLWDRVQSSLAANINGTRSRAPRETSLLAGKIVDERGTPMVAAHACKGKTRYRYYVSSDLQHSGDASASEGWRLPAREIEPLVRDQVIGMLRNPFDVPALTLGDDISPIEVQTLINRGIESARTIEASNRKSALLLCELVSSVRIGAGKVTIALSADRLAALLGLSLNDEPIVLRSEARLKRRGQVMRLVMPSGTPATPSTERSLINAIVQGRAWWDELLANPKLTMRDIARRENLSGPYIVRLVRLAFLSPAILQSVVDGTAPVDMTLDSLTVPNAIEARWERQAV